MPVANDVVWLDVLPSMKGFGPALAKGAESDAEKVGKSTGGKFGKAMLAGIAVVGAGAAAATKALYNIGATFDEVTDTIRVGTGATGKALDDLTGIAKKVGTKVPADFKDVGNAVADLNTRLGLTGKPLEEMSAQFLELSRITGTDVATNIAEVSRVFGDWGVAAEDQSASLDYLFKVSQSTGIGIDQLSQKVVQFGAPMRQFGFSFEESAALMGKWEKEGVNTETVMGGLRAGLGKLSKAGKDPAKAFETLTAQIKSAGTVGEANAIAIETFGQRAGPDLAAAVREGRFDLDELMGSLDASSETIMSAGKDTMDFSEQWQMFKNQVMAGLEPLATRVFAAIGAGMEWVRTSGVPAAKDFLQTLRDWGPVLGAAAAAVAALVVVTAAHSAAMTVAAAGGMAAWLKGTNLVTAATKAWTAVQWAMNAALSANPIGIVVIALAALGVALVVAYKKSDTFREIVQKAWRGIQDAAQFAWERVIRPVFTAWKAYLDNFLIPVIRFLWQNVVRPVFDLIGGAIKAAWAVVKFVFGLWVDYMRNVLFPVIRFLWDNVVKPVFSGIGDTIRWTWNNVIKPPLAALGSFIRDTVAPAFRKGVDAISTAWDRIKAAAARPVNFVIDTVYNNGIRKGFNKVAEFLNLKTELPRMDTIGGRASLPVAAARPTPGGMMAVGGAGGLGNVVKTVGGKAWDWVSDKFMGPVQALLGRVGSSPWAQMAAGAGKKLASGALGKLRSLFDGAEGDGAAGLSGPMGKAGMVLPRGSYRIGMPYLGYEGHYGADYPAPIGTPVYAPWPGRVVSSYDLPGSNPYNDTPYRSYGRVVKVAFDNGMTMLAAHLSSRAGLGAVKAGQIIGTVGNNGNSTGPHLHAEFERNGQKVNPASLGLFDNGGWLKHGHAAMNLSGRPEPVFTGGQWDKIETLAAGGAGNGDVVAELRSLRGDVSNLARDFERQRRQR